MLSDEPYQGAPRDKTAALETHSGKAASAEQLVDQALAGLEVQGLLTEPLEALATHAAQRMR